jgi:hypothetical protein
MQFDRSLHIEKARIYRALWLIVCAVWLAVAGGALALRLVLPVLQWFGVLS